MRITFGTLFILFGITALITAQIEFGLALMLLGAVLVFLGYVTWKNAKSSVGIEK